MARQRRKKGERRERQPSRALRAEREQQRVNIILPDEIHTLAKVIAVAKGITLGEFFNDAISEAVEQENDILRESLHRLGGGER